LARAIHDLSERRARRMVKVNCAALPPTLIEAELFGRERGAYTGALSRQDGRFEIADGSTIFLDEIADLAPEVQVKLLRVLQEGDFERIGSTQTRHVDVRVIAATNCDVAKAVREGRFREDLYYRLNVFPIRVPALRERREDIPLLVWAFVQEFAKSLGRSVESIRRGTMEALQSYSWPGNVRELRNVVERAMILHRGPTLRIDMPETERADASHGLKLEEVERRHVATVLEMSGWRIRGKNGAAEMLGLKPTTLESRLEKLGIRRPPAAAVPA
jgi:transcriptional regulator with GAF, ATPase, and Fis domain